jgi:hypothetical protein
MSYQPTGRPPGRPRKDDPNRPVPKSQPPVSTKSLKIPPSVETKPDYVPPKPVSVAPENSHGRRPGPHRICMACWPGGWPEKATGLACSHGIWSRPWVP